MRNYLYRNQSIHSINQTIALQNIGHAINGGTVEVSALRPQFASYLGIGVGGASPLENRRPDLVVRFGYGTETPRSLRRPLNQVIVV